MARPKSEHATTTIRVKVSNKNYLKKLDEENSNLNEVLRNVNNFAERLQKLKENQDENKD